MKLTAHVIHTNPNSIEEIKIEDVAKFEVDDDNIAITYNDKRSELLPLRANNGEENYEWSGLNIFATVVGLKVDMSK